MSKVNVFELIGKNAISMQSGKKLFEKIQPILIAGGSVELDFSGVTLYASPFFNASIGLLLKDIALEKLQSQLSFESLSEVGRELLNHVIGNAVNFYRNSSNISGGIDQAPLEGGIDD